MLRVLVDATAVPADRGGVGRYLDGLIPALGRLDTVSVVIACQQRDSDSFVAPGIEVYPVSKRTESRPARLGWEQMALMRLARRVDADVLHCPHYTMPVLSRTGRLVRGVGRPDTGASDRPKTGVAVTLHDATFFSDPDVHTTGKGRFFRAATRFALANADALIVPSAVTRSELSRLVSSRADGAIVAHHGVDPLVFRPPIPAEIEALRTELGLGSRPFISFLGTIEPRKNVAALVRACEQVAATRQDAPVLVLAGGKGWDDQADRAIAEAAAPLTVIRAGYLSLPLLPALLAGAELVCYPALGEGFGLPVLEAMACGGVMVTSDRLALPEVGGDAVEYCGTNADDIAATLTRLLDDPARRAELRKRGLERSAQFSWDAAAQAHLQAYDHARIAANNGRAAR